MANEVALSGTIRSNLLTLQNTSDMTNRTNSRLASGMKVGSAVDDAVAYFQAKTLTDRGSDLTVRKGEVDQGISTLNSAINGLQAIEKVLQQMKGVALAAKSSTSATDRVGLKTQFNELAKQVNNLANDTSYQGLNLIATTKNSLKVNFSEKSSSQLTTKGVNVQVSMLAFSAAAGASVSAGLASVIGVGGTAAVSNWSQVTQATAPGVSKFDKIAARLDSMIATIRSDTKSLGANVAMLTTRSDFTKQYVNTLQDGAGKLTLADLNEEGANLVSLQTRQQLGIQALSSTGQQEQGVLRLFR